ncbi:MAG TPA: hypothetical protein VF849_00155 [Blattabacteriaceae bacterium]
MKTLYRLKPICVGNNGTIFYKIQINKKSIFKKIKWIDFDSELLRLVEANKALEELKNFEKENEN